METTAPVYTKPNDKTSVSFYGLRWKKRVPASSQQNTPPYTKSSASLEWQVIYLRHFSVARYTEHDNDAAERRT